MLKVENFVIIFTEKNHKGHVDVDRFSSKRDLLLLFKENNIQSQSYRGRSRVAIWPFKMTIGHIWPFSNCFYFFWPGNPGKKCVAIDPLAHLFGGRGGGSQTLSKNFIYRSALSLVWKLTLLILFKWSNMNDITEGLHKITTFFCSRYLIQIEILHNAKTKT